eukprot:3933151-Pleurochrysis_carterae.AAC.2
MKEPRILRTEQKLRQRGARWRDRDLGADCLERRSGNKQRGGERGDRESRRAVAELKRSSMLSSDADVSKSLPARRAFTVATGPLARTPPAPSSSSAFFRVTAFPSEPNRAFRGVKPRDSFDYGLRRPSVGLFVYSVLILFKNQTVLFHTSGGLFWDTYISKRARSAGHQCTTFMITSRKGKGRRGADVATVDVLGPSMMLGIIRQIDGRLVVQGESSRRLRRVAKLGEQGPKIDSLLGSFRCSYYFCFTRREGDCRLFLAGPGSGGLIRKEKHVPMWNGASTSRSRRSRQPVADSEWCNGGPRGGGAISNRGRA